VTRFLVMEISIAMAVGFVLGRIWSRSVHDLRSVWMADYEPEVCDFWAILHGRPSTASCTLDTAGTGFEAHGLGPQVERARLAAMTQAGEHRAVDTYAAQRYAPTG
jgi:hypothetical protein